MSEEEAIRQVLARFIQLRDDKRFSEWVECFHHDGVFEYLANRLVGRAAIAEHVSELLADDRGKHLCVNSLIEVHGDRAQVSSDFVKLGSGGNTMPVAWNVQVAGRYIDRFERRDGTWRIAERRVVIEGHE